MTNKSLIGKKDMGGKSGWLPNKESRNFLCIIKKFLKKYNVIEEKRKKKRRKKAGEKKEKQREKSYIYIQQIKIYGK